MKVDVAFTPEEAVSAPVAVVVDVLRATSTIAQALASGYPRVLCCRELDEARALRDELGEGILGGERNAIRIEGFDVGASPREFLEGRPEPLILSTTNGTRAILTAAARSEVVLLGSFLNLSAVAAAVAERGRDTAILCAGFQGGSPSTMRTAPGGSSRCSRPNEATARLRRPSSGTPFQTRTPV